MSWIPIDAEDLQNICKGKITWSKCPDCDNNGLQYWDAETGEGACNNPSHINPTRVAYGACDNCQGIGFVFHRK